MNVGMTMTIDPPKYRPAFDPGGGKPLVEGRARTPICPAERDADLSADPLLVGFGTADVDRHPLASA
jgi:hypothetical protein